jgi:RNA polymerase sigma-70 factor, ECF subfamily
MNNGGNHGVDNPNNELPALLATDLEHYFPLLVTLYYSTVYTRVLQNIKRIEDAEDLAQETFTRAYMDLKSKQPAEIRAIRNIRAWLLTIANHTTINHIRWRDSGKRQLSSQGSIDVMQEMNMDISDKESERPDEVVESGEGIQRLHDVIIKLPPQLRKVAVFLAEGYGNKEIASMLNITQDHAGALVSRARKVLCSVMPECKYCQKRQAKKNSATKQRLP